MRILVIGDSCEDVFIYGDIKRIAPEAPVPVIVPIRQESNPGMAANVVANLQALNADVDLVTNKDVIRKIRYVDDRYNQMVLRVDENDTCTRVDQKINTNYDAVIISDYDKGFLLDADIEMIAKSFLNINIPVFLDTKKQLGDWCQYISFIKINSLEYEKNSEIIPQYPILQDKLIVTKGKHGCEYKGKVYNTTDVPVKDVSGAGDTFMSGLVVEYIKSNDIDLAIKFAQECTTIVVQKPGVATI